ncbi:hypothetical protein ATM17_14335 [Sphingopyxis macrogoltabida]|uniref:Uncharacterized protein n=2 Tax=Sphingopyxis TaxID=165697 RepID=A0A0N9U7K8_SPHMC|nr:hypothetical protein AN936_13130 [Sphingopyxis macrogoltabida]AMU90209.1 hypothetical protein ATM17_14335 [Sphingopyxis macrogoltabida]AMU96617.1 hypothetical protein AOA14_18625 [Sphingopyxis terrae subsp. terrae NBRC 15098]
MPGKFGKDKLNRRGNRNRSALLVDEKRRLAFNKPAFNVRQFAIIGQLCISIKAPNQGVIYLKIFL